MREIVLGNMEEPCSPLIRATSELERQQDSSKMRRHATLLAFCLSVAGIAIGALPSKLITPLYLQKSLVVDAAITETGVRYPTSSRSMRHTNSSASSNENTIDSDPLLQRTPSDYVLIEDVGHRMLLANRHHQRHDGQDRSSMNGQQSSHHRQQKAEAKHRQRLLSSRQHNRQLIEAEHSDGPEVDSRIFRALSEREHDEDFAQDTRDVLAANPDSKASLATPDNGENGQDSGQHEDASSSAAAVEHGLNCDQDGGKDFHERLTAQAIMAAGLESIYEAASIELRHTMILTSYHKMGTVMMKDLAWAITKILAPWKQCYLQHCQFEDLQSPPGCELVSFIQDGSEKMTSSFCEQALQYARSTPWTQWNPHMGIIILGMNGAFIPVNATPPAVRVVEFVRDPWDVSTSNYAYTLKGAEDWMFREKEAWGGLSFYDAVHAEEGPLSAALFSIWEEMNLMQNIDENVPNVLYVRFEDMIASLQATINRILSHIGIPEMLHSPVSHHMCLNQKSLFEASASCLYNEKSHISDPSVKDEAKQAMAEDSWTRERLDQLRAELDARVPCQTENCGRGSRQSHETCAAEFMNNMGNQGFDLDNFDTVHN
mmetsp:Transcript_6347/g.23467  ORF Transcript_6347/g.23467 Transcript_6347/m.23467 type:complete len:601 (+) Transcript_6347:67-1869(+)